MSYIFLILNETALPGLHFELGDGASDRYMYSTGRYTNTSIQIYIYESQIFVLHSSLSYVFRILNETALPGLHLELGDGASDRYMYTGRCIYII